MLLLFTPERECLTSLPAIRARGYDVSLVDTRVSTSSLTGALDAKVKVRNTCNQFQNALRAAWANMLRRFANADYYTIFGESDCHPHVSADRLKEWIDMAPAKAKALRLNNVGGSQIVLNPRMKDVNLDDQAISWLPVPPSGATAPGWGTHALWVHPSARLQLAEYFEGITAATDVTLCILQKHIKDFPIYRASVKLMSQQKNGTRMSSSPVGILAVLVIKDRTTDLAACVRNLKLQVPETAKIVLSLPPEMQALPGTKFFVRKNEVETLEDIVPGASSLKEDYPMTTFLSQDSIYPSNYLEELSTLYMTIPWDFARFGFRGMYDYEVGLHSLYRGTLTVRTSALPTTKIADVTPNNRSFLFYDFGLWNDLDYMIQKAPQSAAVIAPFSFGYTIVLDGASFRVYNGYVYSSTTQQRGVITYKAADELAVHWETSEPQRYKEIENNVYVKI